MYRCGDEIDIALRCIQNADLEVSVFLSDNSPEELTAERLKWAFPGVVVVAQDKNSGISRAHNAILPQLQSKYHLLLDTGVSFHPSLLRRMISYMEAHPNIAVLSPRFFNEAGEELFFPRKQLSIRYLTGSALSGFGGIFLRWQREYTMADQNVDMPVPVDTAPVQFLLIRTEVFRKLNGFDPGFTRLQEDADLCRNIQSNHLGSIVCHPEMQVVLREETKSNLLFANHVHSFKTVARYFIKWGITW